MVLILSSVQIRILKFFGHIIRNENSVEGLVAQGKVESKRSRERSQTRWTDLIKSVTHSSINDNTQAAKQRDTWRHRSDGTILEGDMTTTIPSRVNDSEE
ncbi:unnamed protein product, partial [Brenthis ino]